MFGIKKLKRKINDLDISRNEWMKIAKTGIEEIKTLKEKIEAMKISRDLSQKEIESQMSTIQDLRKKFGSNYAELSNCRKVVTERDNTIKTLQSEVERLTRKRDAKGRFVKSAPIKHGFKVGDKVRIKDGISSKTNWAGRPHFAKEMDRFLGKTHVIERLVYNGTVRFVDDPSMWHFHPDWLEHAE